jgi:V/A-type H+-transporting ATPase subunit E
MEELRSTEILDKEIQEDARKKAERLLADADSECRKIHDMVAVRAETVRTEKTAAYSEKIAQLRKDDEAPLPLEKARFLVSFENTAVQAAIDRYLSELSEEKKLLLLQSLLRRYKPVIGDNAVSITVRGFALDAVNQLVCTELGKTSVVSCELLADTTVESAESGAGFTIETVDHKIRCRVTLQELMYEIIDANIYELASALFGGRLPQ